MPSAITGRRDVMSRTNGNNGAPFQMVSFPKGVMWHSSINMKKVTVYLSRMKKALKEKEVNLKEKKKLLYFHISA